MAGPLVRHPVTVSASLTGRDLLYPRPADLSSKFFRFFQFFLSAYRWSLPASLQALGRVLFLLLGRGLPLPGPGYLLEEEHPAQGGVGRDENVHGPIGHLGDQEPQDIAQPEPKEGAPEALGTVQPPAEDLAQGVFRVGAQAVPHRQKDAVQPEGEHQGGNGQHRGPYLEERAGGGIGRHGGGGGVEQVEEVQAGYGGQDTRQAHPGAQEQLHHNSFAELAALAEPPQHRAHPGLAAAPEHAPVLLHHPQADGGQNEQNHHAEHHKADQLGIGHGDGQHHLGQVHPEEDVV